MRKDSNDSLTRILREDGQRTNLKILPQYIHVQDISFSIGIVRYYGHLNYNPKYLCPQQKQSTFNCHSQ